MTETLSEFHLGSEMMARLKRIASEIFARHGVDFGTACRAGGWTNMTWLADGLALRLSTRPGNDSIRREAKLASLLPPEVGYPQVIEVGVSEGHEWSLCQEVAGECLGDAWDSLDEAQRASALRQLWDKAQAVHSVNPALVESLARKQSWYNATDPGEALVGIQRVTEQGLFSPREGEALLAALNHFWQARECAPWVLNHGDLTLENAMWHEGKVSALLDFEYAVMAPAALDLNLLVEHAFEPLAEPGGMDALQSAVAELAVPLIAPHGGMDLLTGYAILLNLWRFEEWLAHPEGEGPIETWDPYQRLLAIARGEGSYLAALAANVSG